ncbi:hypothetical protein MTO96_013576 [Rhipicephalus appendiculatus]
MSALEPTSERHANDRLRLWSAVTAGTHFRTPGQTSTDDAFAAPRAEYGQGAKHGKGIKEWKGRCFCYRKHSAIRRLYSRCNAGRTLANAHVDRRQWRSWDEQAYCCCCWPARCSWAAAARPLTRAAPPERQHRGFQQLRLSTARGFGKRGTLPAIAALLGHHVALHRVPEPQQPPVIKKGFRNMKISTARGFGKRADS